MRYSFTPAQPKHILSKIVKIWLFYIILSLAIIGGFYTILRLQVGMASHNIDNFAKKQEFFETEIAKITQKYNRAKFELDVIKSDDIDNYVIKDGIVNFLNLIPDQITISYMKIDTNALVIRGITPSKEIFKYLLQNPLQAIFGKSEVTFYMLSNGWYEFVSQSHTEEPLIQNKDKKQIKAR